MDGLVSVPGFQRDVLLGHNGGLWVWDQKKYCAVGEMEEGAGSSRAGSSRAGSFDSGVGLEPVKMGKA